MPRIVDHDAQRDALVDACFRLMAIEGYDRASMRRIAKAAGVSTGTLYHYFPDKQAILSHLFARIIAGDAERVGATLPDDAPLDARLKAVLAFVDREEEHLRAVLRIVLEAHRHAPDEAARASVVEAVRGYRSSMAAVLGIDDDLLVTLLFQQLLGVLVHGVLDPEGVDLDAVGQVVMGWAKA